MISYCAIILYGQIAYMFVDMLKEIEMQSGFFRLLVYLSRSGEKQITDIIDETGIPIHQTYKSIRKAESLGLVKSRIDNSKYPARNLISLTEKGEMVSAKVMEIVSIINNEG